MTKPTVSSQIKHVEEEIKLKESLGKDASFEKELVKAWKLWIKKYGDQSLGEWPCKPPRRARSGINASPPRPVRVNAENGGRGK